MKKKTSSIIALTAVLITALSVWYTQRPVATKQSTWDDVLAEAAVGGYQIISTEELADRYRKDASGLLLVDTRQIGRIEVAKVESKGRGFRRVRVRLPDSA